MAQLWMLLHKSLNIDLTQIYALIRMSERKYSYVCCRGRVRVNFLFFTLGSQQIISKSEKSRNSRVCLLPERIVENIRTAERVNMIILGA